MMKSDVKIAASIISKRYRFGHPTKWNGATLDHTKEIIKQAKPHNIIIFKAFNSISLVPVTLRNALLNIE
jgi:hypothetical protein